MSPAPSESIGWLRADLEPGIREGVESWLLGQGFRIDGDRFQGATSLDRSEEFSDRLLALHEISERRWILWFHDASGSLRKRLRSRPTARVLGSMLGPEGVCRYGRVGTTVDLTLRYDPQAPVAGLAERVLVLREILERIDKKALVRWVEKFLARKERNEG